MMFPVYLYQEGSVLDAESTYFLVAGNGLFLHKNNGVVSGLVPVDNISVLDDLRAEAFTQWKLPKIPFEQVYKLKTLFRKVVDLYQAECNALVYYSKAEEQYLIHIPQQVVSHAAVRYQRTRQVSNDYLLVGTIHSHCDFQAFHSGTDESDESDFDGLHVTFGHNHLDQFTISATVAMNGHRQKINPDVVLEGVVPVGSSEFVLNPTLDRASVWDEEVTQWLKNVRPMGSEERACGIVSGDFVNWEEHTGRTWKQTYGEGPFQVLEVQGSLLGPLVKIQTTVQGTPTLGAYLFRRMNCVKKS